MQDRCTYIPWSPHISRNGSHCTRAAISRHALEVFIDLPKPQVSACELHVMNYNFARMDTAFNAKFNAVATGHHAHWAVRPAIGS
jgi:hypothetical protein